MSAHCAVLGADITATPPGMAVGANEMNEEQKKWSRQYSSNFGAKEFLRLGCAIIIWLLIGIGISIAFDLAGYSWGSIVIAIFFIAMFTFAFTAYSRKSSYLLLRKIIGNDSFPQEPYPRSTVKTPRQPLPWLYYVLAIWRWILALFVLYFIIKYVLK